MNEAKERLENIVNKLKGLFERDGSWGYYIEIKDKAHLYVKLTMKNEEINTAYFLYPDICFIGVWRGLSLAKDEAVQALYSEEFPFTPTSDEVALIEEFKRLSGEINYINHKIEITGGNPCLIKSLHDLNTERRKVSKELQKKWENWRERKG